MDESQSDHSSPEDRPATSGAAESPDLSVGKVAAQAVGELAGLERRLPQTLIRLLTRPGFLTLEHRSGRGANYVSPVRLYLLVSTLYFATSFAVAGQGLNLGLVTVTEMVGGLPSVAPALILIAAVPLFAALLAGLFPRSSPVGLGEYLVFALYFQSVLLLVLILVELLPIDDPANDYMKIGFFVGYVGLAARRLWSSHLLVAFGKALLSLILYALCILLATAAIAGIQGLVSG